MEQADRKRVAIFVSGLGTNMENIAKHVTAGKLDCQISVVVCDKPDAFAVKRAGRLGLDTFVVKRRDFKFKTELEDAINDELQRRGVEAIFLAGYMRILGPAFVRAWPWKILNVHPSMLPKYPGVHAIREAFEAQEEVTGVTVHFVDEDVDTGPMILQRVVAIRGDDTLESLERRVHETEYELYPEAIKLFLAGKLKVVEGKRVEILK